MTRSLNEGMRVLMKRAATAVIMAGLSLLSACSPLGAYNALIPTDVGARLAASDVAYGSNPRQQLDVYVPSVPGEKRPVVVVFYGGSWNSGRRQDYAFLGQALASRGNVVVIADYRLVPEVRFPTFLEDGASAVVWARDHASTYGGDPHRLFVLGHSAGAYIAAMVALDARYLRAAGGAPSMIAGVVGLAGPYDFLPLDVDVAIAAFGGAHPLTDTQPITFVTAAAPPMLLATGANDTTVRPRNSTRLAERLRAAGVAATLKTYPDVTHVGIMLALSVPFRSQAPVLDDVAAFIATGGR